MLTVTLIFFGGWGMGGGVFNSITLFCRLTTVVFSTVQSVLSSNGEKKTSSA